MATKKDINNLLQELGLSHDEMQNLWEDLKDVNPVVNNLIRNGKNWTDLTTNAIRDIPGNKERCLQQAKEAKEKELAEEAIEKKEQEERDYYYDHFEEIMVSKIDDGEELTEDELIELRKFEVELEKHENGRWSRAVSSILKLCDRFFMLNWEEGLTEYQENEFYEQPFEVEKKEYEKTITVTEWVMGKSKRDSK